MTLHYTNRLSQVFAERITRAVDAQFGRCHHAPVEEVANEKAYRAVDASLDSHAFLNMILDLIRALFCSQIASLHSVSAIQSASSIQESFSLSTSKVTPGREEGKLPHNTPEGEIISPFGDENTLGF